MRHTRKGTQTPLLFLVRDMPFGGPGGPSSGAWWSTTLVCVHCTREHRLCAMRPSEMADAGSRGRFGHGLARALPPPAHSRLTARAGRPGARPTPDLYILTSDFLVEHEYRNQ